MNSPPAIQLWLKEIMDDSVLSVNSSVPAFEAAKLMENSRLGAIVVLENQSPAGIVTNKDLTMKIIAHSYPADTPLRRIMSAPLISITPQTNLKTAAELMSSRKIRKLPIIEGDEVIGMVVASEIAMVENP
ncbi:MAG: CBS domain-containing protein [Nitrosopumilaceae archaeon]|nr:CBS domain-containing protein [Nitrosopumilaceae archaeon]